MPVFRNLRTQPDPLMESRRIGSPLDEVNRSPSSTPKRKLLGTLRDRLRIGRRGVPSSTHAASSSSNTYVDPSPVPGRKLLGSFRDRFSPGHPTTRHDDPLTPSTSGLQTPQPQTPAASGRSRRRRNALKNSSWHKSLPPILSSPSDIGDADAASSNPLPSPGQRLLHPDSAQREGPVPNLAATGFSPAQGQNNPPLVEPQYDVPDVAPGPGLNPGPPPGLTKRLAERQDGLPYAVLHEERRMYHPLGMNAPPLGTTYVSIPEVGSDGNPLRIDFDFMGLLCPNPQIFGALARPRSKDLDTFPRFVAVKMVRKTNLAVNNHKYLSLCIEVEIMKKLAGEAFVNGALAVFQDHDFVYIVSRWYAGDLATYIQSWTERMTISFPLHCDSGTRVMPPEVFRFYAGELLLGMKMLRDHNIVHTDLKPQNALVSPSGHLVLADFDCSFFDVSQAMREQGDCKYEDVAMNIRHGTDPYMAPEVLQYFDESRLPSGPIPTPRVDLWSLGMTLLEFAIVDPLTRWKPIMYSLGSFHEGFYDAMREGNPELAGPQDISPKERLDRVLDRDHLTRCKSMFHPDVYAFIEKLLSPEPRARGSIPELMQHSIFVGMDWDGLQTSVPKLVELGVCEPQERAKLLPALAYGVHSDSGTQNLLHALFPEDTALTLSYENFSDWIATGDSSSRSSANDLHGLVVPFMQLPPE